MSIVQLSVDVWSKANESALAFLYNSRFPKFEDYRWKQLVEHQYIEYARGGRYVNSQGSSLTSSARLRLQQRAHVRSFMHPILEQQVAETLVAVAKLEEQGATPWINPNKFNIREKQEFGTPSVAEWMGY
jgi:hypothetical protein